VEFRPHCLAQSYYYTHQSLTILLSMLDRKELKALMWISKGQSAHTDSWPYGPNICGSLRAHTVIYSAIRAICDRYDLAGSGDFAVVGHTTCP
jgi:hypothetical protein